MDLFELAKCRLALRSYEVKQQTRSMSDIPIPSFLKSKFTSFPFDYFTELDSKIKSSGVFHRGR